VSTNNPQTDFEHLDFFPQTMSTIFKNRNVDIKFSAHDAFLK